MLIDFGDGSGYRWVVLDQPVLVDYRQKTQGVEIEQHTLRFFVPGNSDFVPGRLFSVSIPGPDETLLVSKLVLENPCISLTSDSIGEARVYIRYGKSQAKDQVIRKPFILIEGFDLDENPGDERFGQISWSTLIAGISFDVAGASCTAEFKGFEASESAFVQ